MYLMFVTKETRDIVVSSVPVGGVGPAADSDEMPIRRWQIRILRKNTPQ